jgi:hypothetical protein
MSTEQEPERLGDRYKIVCAALLRMVEAIPGSMRIKIVDLGIRALAGIATDEDLTDGLVDAKIAIDGIHERLSELAKARGIKVP